MTNMLPIDHIRLDGNQWFLFSFNISIFVTYIKYPLPPLDWKAWKTYIWEHKQANRNYSPSRFCILIDNNDFYFIFIAIGHAYFYTISFLGFLRLVSTTWDHEVLPTIRCSTSKIFVLFLILANSVILLRYNYRHVLLLIKKLKWTKLYLKGFFS